MQRNRQQWLPTAYVIRRVEAAEPIDRASDHTADEAALADDPVRKAHELPVDSQPKDHRQQQQQQDRQGRSARHDPSYL